MFIVDWLYTFWWSHIIEREMVSDILDWQFSYERHVMFSFI